MIINARRLLVRQGEGNNVAMKDRMDNH